MEHLDDRRVREHLAERGNEVAHGEQVDDPVLLARADLHEAQEARVRAVAVVLEVDSDVLRAAQRRQHLRERRRRRDEREGRRGERPGLGRSGRLEHTRGVVNLRNLKAVWMTTATGSHELSACGRDGDTHGSSSSRSIESSSVRFACGLSRNVGRQDAPKLSTGVLNVRWGFCIVGSCSSRLSSGPDAALRFCAP